MAGGHDAAHGDMEIKQHVGTYGGFLVLLKWGTIISVILAAIVVLLIAS